MEYMVIHTFAFISIIRCLTRIACCTDKWHNPARRTRIERRIKRTIIPITTQLFLAIQSIHFFKERHKSQPFTSWLQLPSNPLQATAPP